MAVVATRVLAGPRRGSSRPVLVATADGERFVKLRGAGQGTAALVAEVIVAELAEALGLRVPARSLVTLAPDTPSDDKNDELADLLAASVGENLGFAPLPNARDFAAGDEVRVAPAEAATILWLDRLVLNPDRTRRNPNLLWSHGDLYLIDHGAALRFQYDWRAVTEAMPRAAGTIVEPHLFETAAASEEWAALDAKLASLLERPILERAVAAVPASFLAPLLPVDAKADALRRRRAAYAAFLWKRLKAPRAFRDAAPEPARPRAKPHRTYPAPPRHKSAGIPED